MGLMKKLTSVVVTAGLLLSLVGTALASYPADAAPAATRLQNLGIVQGDENGLRLGDPITRAELIKIIVWAFGKGNDAKFLKGAPAFPDTANHWASGEIALAKNLIEANGFKLGNPDGTFAPQNNVTTAEAIAMVMKFLGAPADASQAWPNDYLNGAVAAGILSASDKETLAATANAAATRGLVFYLADTAFATYKLASGKTVYTQYVRPTAPTLTVDEIAPTTDSSVTVTGSVSSVYTGTLTVTVGDSTNVATVANGKFTATVSDLAMGDNSIPVMVTDEVGNLTTGTAKVTRTVGTPAAISATSSVTVAAGESADLAIEVKDDKGNVIADAPVDFVPTLGTYADGKFTAGTKAGTETVTAKSGDLTADVAITVNPGALAKVVVSPATAAMQAGATLNFKASGEDAYGNAVPVTASWSTSVGVMDPTTGTYGAPTGTSGDVTITATAGGIPGTATVTVYGVPSKIVFSTPTNLPANDSSETTITASVVDAAGNVVPSFNKAITFRSTSTDVATVTGSAAAVNGVASATITAGTIVGSTVLTASADGITGATLSYSTVSQTLTSVTLTPDSTGIGTSNSVSLTAQLADQMGEDMLHVPSSGVTLKLMTSDKKIVAYPGTSDNYTMSFSAGSTTTSATVTITGGTGLGSATLSGSVTSPSTLTGVAVTGTTVSTMIVGSANTITVDPITTKTAGNNLSIKAKLLDANGNLATGSSSTTLTLYRSGASTGLTATTSHGIAKFSYARTVAGTSTYEVRGSNLVSGSAEGTILPATAYKVLLTVTPDHIAADGVAVATLTAEISDTYGNTVTDGAYNVTIKKLSGSNVVFSDTTVTTANGEGSTTAVSTSSAATSTFQATATGLVASTVKTLTTQILGAPHGLDLSVEEESGDVAVGDTYTVDVAVVDSNGHGHTVTSDQGRAVTLTVKDDNGVVTQTLTANTEDGVASFDVTQTSTEREYSFSASSSGLLDSSIVSGYQYVAGPAVALKVDTLSGLTAFTAGSDFYMDVTAVDEYGNTASTGTDLTDASLTVSPTTTYGSLDDDALGAGYENKLRHFEVTHVGGTVTFTAQADGLTEGTLSVDLISGGAADGIVADAPSSAAAIDADTYADVADGQIIKVNVVDGVGVKLTGTANNQYVTLSEVSDKAADKDGGDDANADKAYYWSNNYGEHWTSYTLADDDAAQCDNGQVWFKIENEDAETVTYTFTGGSGFTTNDLDVVGTFTGSSTIAKVMVDDANPHFVRGDGSSVAAVPVRVVDANGNTVTSFNGVGTASILSGTNFASLLDSSVPINNGVGNVLVMSKSGMTSDSDVDVQVDVDWNADGTIDDTDNAERNHMPDAVVVDSTDPTVTIDTVGKDAAPVAGLDANSYGARPAITVTPDDGSGSGVASVKYEYLNLDSVNADWTTIGTKTSDDASFDLTTADWGSKSLADATKYAFRATVTDELGYTSDTTTSEDTADVADSAVASLGVAITGVEFDTVAGTITIAATGLDDTAMDVDISKVTFKDLTDAHKVTYTLTDSTVVLDDVAGTITITLGADDVDALAGVDTADTATIDLGTNWIYDDTGNVNSAVNAEACTLS